MDRANNSYAPGPLARRRVVAIIPARYASSRFPGKPLALIGGRPMVEWVYRVAMPIVDEVVVATDDMRIANAVEAFGGRAVLTSAEHYSGTGRVWEAYCKLGLEADVILNLQGDEPFMPSDNIMRLLDAFNLPSTDIATLVYKFSASDDFEILSDPNRPKVVIGSDGFAKYFSRSVIPYVRGVPMERWPLEADFFLHQGVYAFTPEALERAVSLPPSPLELAERLEQLTWLSAGINIRAIVTELVSHGIDTPEDLVNITRRLSQR